MNKPPLTLKETTFHPLDPYGDYLTPTQSRVLAVIGFVEFVALLIAAVVIIAVMVTKANTETAEITGMSVEIA